MNGERYWAVLEPYWAAIDVDHEPGRFAETYAAVPTVPRILFATHLCRSEICNGGLHQFFKNPSGVLAPEAAEGFERLGLPEAAMIIREAMAFFGGTYPRDQAERQELLRRVPGKAREEWDPFHQLDLRLSDALDGDGDRFEIAADAFVGMR